MNQDSQPPAPPIVEPPAPPLPPKPPLTTGKILVRVFLGLMIAGLLLFGVCLAVMR